MRSVRWGAADGLCGASDDMQIWCVLLFGAELSLLFGGIRPRRSRSSRMRWSYRRGAYCGVWVLRSGECRFEADCKRAKRVAEYVAEGSKLVAPTDFGSDVCAGGGGEA